MKCTLERLRPSSVNIFIIISKFSLLHFFFAISAGSNPGSRALMGNHFLFDRQKFSEDMGGS